MTDQVAGDENDGPSKSWGVKMQDMKMQDLTFSGLCRVQCYHYIFRLTV